MERAQHVVKRPNETIGIVPAGKQRITHLVRRLYSVMLLFSQQQGEKEEYSAVLSEMLEAANSSGSNRTQVKAILREIRAIGVDWNVRDGDREVWKNVGLIEEPGLVDGKGTPTIVTWKLPAIIRTRLLDPRGFFTRISLEMMTRLRSGASIALYEICCQYASNDHGKGEGGLTNRATIAEWMPRLTGSRRADYEYKFLKRDVLLTAIQEINLITDLRVELLEHKHGRKVGELQFRVFRKSASDIRPINAGGTVPARLAPAVEEPSTLAKSAKKVPGKASGSPAKAIGQAQPGEVTCAAQAASSELRRILALGAPIGLAERICRKYGGDLPYLLRHLDYAEARILSTVSAPLVNKVAFLQKALDRGYADGATAVLVTATAPMAPRVSPEIVAQEQAKLARRAQVWARFQGLPDETEKASMVEEFLQQTGPTLKTFYKKNGVNNMIVKGALTDWLIDKKGF